MSPAQSLRCNSLQPDNMPERRYTNPCQCLRQHRWHEQCHNMSRSYYTICRLLRHRRRKRYNHRQNCCLHMNLCQSRLRPHSRHKNRLHCRYMNPYRPRSCRRKHMRPSNRRCRPCMIRRQSLRVLDSQQNNSYCNQNRNPCRS